MDFMTAVASEETLYAKECFEHICGQHDVFVENFYYDNGCFADKAIVYDAAKMGQSISYFPAYANC